MDIKKIPIGKNPPNDINVIIEIPLKGDPVKYEIDKESGAMFVDRFLYTAMFYPGNYGFIPHTLGGDGDPLDIIVLGPTPVVPGAVVRSRPVGCLMMEDEAGGDEKIIAVPVDNARSCRPEELIAIVRTIDPVIPVVPCGSTREALAHAEGARALVAGSLFLVGEALVALGLDEGEMERSEQ